MPDIVFRVYFDNQPATQEQLDRIEEITVEQEVDKTWQASIQIPICVCEKGIWSGDDEKFMKAFKRVRIEIKADDKKFVALIDGPIVGFDSQMHSEPGQSQITLLVHDDTVYLNRKQEIKCFEKKKDSEIVAEIFKKIDEIEDPKIETTSAPPEKRDYAVVQRGSAMEILRSLAKRQGKHVYVLPGEKAGDKSIGYFQSFSHENSGLPALVLLGRERNVEIFNVQNNAQSPAQVTASTLSISDKVVITKTSSFRNLELLGKEHAFKDESETAELLLSPRQGEAIDLEQAVTADAEAASYAFSGNGKVLGKCYPGVLQPYQVITVKGVNSRMSGDYLITAVTHRLTTEDYNQEFKVKRNAVSSGPETDSGPAFLDGDIGASLSLGVSFNISGSIV